MNGVVRTCDYCCEGSGGDVTVTWVPCPIRELMSIAPPIASNRASSEPRPMWSSATYCATIAGSKPVRRELLQQLAAHRLGDRRGPIAHTEFLVEPLHVGLDGRRCQV